MTSNEIREKFIRFFEEKEHKELLPSPLVPDTVDPSVLFTTAGMQQFKSWFSGEEKPKYPRVVTIQPCLRTSDIDEVGDKTHLTFFEMLGNFSFNNYFKKEAIEWAWEFLTDKKWLGIDKKRIHATYFDQNKSEKYKNVSTDAESREILEKIKGLEKIIGEGDDNFWSLGSEGSPGGPTVEFYVDDVEVWNLVFNEVQLKDGKWIELAQKGVDTGMGLERIVAVMQGKEDVFEIDTSKSIIEKIEKISGKNCRENEKAFRVIADHIKASIFIFSSEVNPANIGRGYILRRLLRRAIRYGWMLGIKDSLLPIMNTIIEVYRDAYPELDNHSFQDKFKTEEEKFQKAINEGLKKAKQIFDAKKPISHDEFAKIMQLEDKGDILGKIYANPPSEEIVNNFKKALIKVTNNQIHQAYITGLEAFNLYQTNGFPIEMIVEMAQEADLFVDINGFKAELNKHKELSRTASAGMFKGGLADESKETIKLHTAAHLLLAALQQVLGDEVMQKGSNITAERLRFDFSHPQKLTNEEIKKVEELVNQKVKEAVTITMKEMSLQEAKKFGAHGTFSDRYGDRAKVYSINDFSKEICGGPHVKNTSEIGHFKIIKEEASSAGVRRIKATLEKES